MVANTGFVRLPQNLNYLTQVGFRLSIDRYPGVEYFCVNANVPGITLQGGAPSPTPFVDVPYPGHKVTFEPFAVSFIIDEKMTNWEEIVAWMKGLGYPESFDQYAEQVNTRDGSVRSEESQVFSDITLTVLSNKHNPIREVVMHDAFPTTLSPVQFTTAASDIEYLTADVTFLYSHFTTRRL